MKHIDPLAPSGKASRSAIVGWLLFDWACQPFFTLVTTFVFAPYFASALAPDAVSGQSLWGYATAAAGFVLAFLSPVLGSIADATGPKKPWIAACGLVLFVASLALWYAAPGEPHAIAIALMAFAFGTVAVEVAAVFNNAMIPHLVPPERYGRLSGTGWAMGYCGGLVSLVIVLGFLAADAGSGKTVLGFAPLFGLDPATREGDRITGPFSAVWFLIFVLPLFLFTPDIPRSAMGLKEAARQGVLQIRKTVADARRHESVGRFLLANMVYQDALVALFAFGGIYGAGVFGWQAVELGVFGILLTVTGTLGALIGGRLDDRFGAKPVILGAILVLALVCLGVLSLGREHILFVVSTAPPVPADGIYGSASERMFVLLGLVIGSVAGPLQASSRSLLARLVPAREAGRYFGLLALSGKVTSFLAPLAVAVATAIFQTQAAGPAVLILFLLAGFWLLSGVKRV
ncbi:UMF1 family MFS transporter [Microvirga flocculans]|uniref:UMF1 family MFS transporter n=1 Tax=Microvirga flocculans TaxID=217168 RepID=A0A7W6II18_9HYPH|nr:MFS transporter [Microvirga flocculans]MBB4041279.1 UMF1 family MFS transporter [Microvirga flocculans]